MWAAVMTMENSPGDIGEKFESRRRLYPLRRFRNSRRFWHQRVPGGAAWLPTIAAHHRKFAGNDAPAHELGGIAHRRERNQRQARSIAKEKTMRNRIVAIAAIAAAIGTPI